MQLTPWRRAVVVLLVTVTGIVVGAASSVNLASGTLGAARTATPRCTTAGVTVLQNLAGSTITSVTVSGLPSSCGGATLQLTVNNGLANSGGSAAVPAGGGTVTVTLAAAPAVTAWEQTDLVLVGP